MEQKVAQTNIGKLN